jgi:hypothetical protein
MRACARCGVRWVQDALGLCRQCRTLALIRRPAPELGRCAPTHVALTGWEARREADAANCARRLPRPPGPIRTAVYEGVEFEVMFDGA